MNTRALLTTSLITGLLMAVLSNLPVVNLGNCLACIWLWGSAILGVYIYRKLDRTGSLVDAGRGAAIGALSGLVGAVIGSILSIVFGSTSLAALTAMQSGNLEEVFGGAAESLAFTGVTTLIGLLINLVLYPLFGAFGGLLGGLIFTQNSPGR